MKKFTFRAILVMAVFLFSFHLTGWGQLLMVEDFDYPVGDLITAHGWTNHSGTTNPITVRAASITYTDYISSGIGNEISMVASAEDDNKSFTAQTSGSVYASFLVNVTAALTGDYFIHLGPNAIGTVFRGRVFVKKDASNNLSFGLSMSSTTISWTEFTYAMNTTYLLVLKYTFVAGTQNDIVNLFINPDPLLAEPLPTLTNIDVPASDPADIGSVALRQGDAAKGPSLKLDGIRIGTTWDGIFDPPAPTVETPVIEPPAGIYETPQTVTMTCATEGASIFYTIDGTDPDDGSDPYPVEGISVSTNTTVKAIAYKSGMNPSFIATSIYRFPELVDNVAALRAGATDGTVYKLTGEAIVTYTRPAAGSNQKFVQDATGAILIHDVAGTIATPYVIGDGMTGLTGTLTLYNALLELIPTSDPGAPSSTGNPVVPEVKTLGNITSADQSKLISVADVAFAAPGGNFTANTSYTISDPSKSAGVLRTTFSEADYIGTVVPAALQTMVALVGQYTTTIQLTPRSLADMTPMPAPAIIIDPTELSGFNYMVGEGPSDPQTFTISGSYLDPAAGDITVTAFNFFEVSSDNITFGATATYPYTGGALAEVTAYVRMMAGLAAGNYPDSVKITGGGAAERLLSCDGSVDQPPAVYTWQGADEGLWTEPANWSPERTTPLANDALQFNDGTTRTITGLPAAETIARLSVSNNTTINLQAGAAAVLTIAGDATGDDFVVDEGSALNCNAPNAIVIAIATGATGSVNGSMAFSSTVNTAHKITAADAAALIFNNGATFTAGLFFTSNAFGNTTPNSVLFASGSAYIHKAGSNPFVNNPPNSIVVFQTGSLYKVTGTSGPSFSGKTYANFELDSPEATITTSGTSAVTMDNLTVTNGTLKVNMTGTPGHSIKGNIHVASTGTLNFNPTSAGTVLLNGSSLQTISNEGTLSTNTNSTLGISNANGVVLLNNIRIDGALQLNDGQVVLGSGVLVLGPAASITGTPSAASMVVATGTGELRKEFTVPGSFTYPVGNSVPTAEYSPVTLNFTSGAFAAEAYAGVNLSNEKYPTDPNTGNYLNRYWNVTQTGISDFTCDATFQYLPTDVHGDENGIYCVRVDPMPYVAYDPANVAEHQLTGTGLTSLSTFTGTVAVPELLDITNETVSDGQSNCYNATQTITVAGNETTFLVENGGDATLIAGQNIIFLPGTTVQPGGHMWAYITTTSSYCGAISPAVAETPTKEIPVTTLQSGRSAFRVYPNPTPGSFTLEITGSDNASVHVEIYRMTGERIVTESLTGDQQHRFSIENQPTGIYILRLLNSEMTGTVKIIKQ